MLVPKGRCRADDAARIGDCLHHCADCRAGRAVFHRLGSVPAAIRDRGHAGGRRPGTRRGQAGRASVADALAAAALRGGRGRQRSRQGSRRQARCRIQPGLADARRMARHRIDDRRHGARSRSRSARQDRLAGLDWKVQSGIAGDRPFEPYRPRRAARRRKPRDGRAERYRLQRRRAIAGRLGAGRRQLHAVRDALSVSRFIRSER